MSKMSYLVDLSTLKFDELAENVSSWIMAMPIGKYNHPVYGKIDITSDRVQRFAANVNNGVRGIDLDIDYDHKEYGGEAAGWVRQAEPRNDGLWILVEWTTKAYEAIKSKAYRYFSPEFDDTWTHPSSGEKFKDVLFGGGITNRPFLKGIQPLNLSEDYYKTGEIKLKENNSMDPDQIKELAAKLGLDESATSEMLFGALMLKLSTPEVVEPVEPNDDGEEATEQTSVTAQLSEHPLIKKLTEQLEKQSTALKEREIGDTIKSLNESAIKGGHLIAPAHETAIRKLLSESSNDEYSTVLVKLLSDIFGEVGPAAGEIAKTKKLAEDAQTDTKKFNDTVTKLMNERKIGYAEAAVIAAAEDESAFEAYRNDSYAREGE